MLLRAEVSTEPYRFGSRPPAHAVAVHDAAREGGLDAEFGPLGTAVTGEDPAVLAAVHRAVHAGLAHGATRVTVQVSVLPAGAEASGNRPHPAQPRADPSRSAPVSTVAEDSPVVPEPAFDQALVAAIRPVAQALGATVVPPGDAQPADIPLRWAGQVVGALRLPGLDLTGALERLVAAVEADLGQSLRELSRRDKQRAVGMLEERGAFQLRGAAEVVAGNLGVSRFTVYNYLNRDDSS